MDVSRGIFGDRWEVEGVGGYAGLEGEFVELVVRLQFGIEICDRSLQLELRKS